MTKIAPLSLRHQQIHHAFSEYVCQKHHLAAKTAEHFTMTLERYLPRFLNQHQIDSHSSIYDITPPDRLEQIRQQILQQPEWKKFDQKSHGSTFVSSLKYYRLYLLDTAEHKEEFPVVIPETDTEGEVLQEGSAYDMHATHYERNRKARQACIDHYGTRCTVCGFDFEKFYGNIGCNFIEVHHLVPLSDIGKNYCVDPVKDLRPVCSNCHSMLHRGKHTLSIEELQHMLQ